jgi:alpha-tubulin suppressor-like RCC1 family protein
MPRIPIALPGWNTLAFFGLLNILSACGDDGTGPPLEDEPPDGNPVAFLLESVILGTRHTCGLTTQGKAYCWGYNEYGQLGDGTTTNDSTPVAVAGDLTFRTLEAGGLHTCGIATDGAVYCWGANNQGQLGDGTTADRPVPGKVAGAPQLVSLHLGGGYSCGLTAAGSAYCWGWNIHSQFGNGKELVEGACALHDGRPPGNLYCMSPLPAAGELRLRTLEPGSWHACGLALDGEVYCWGVNAQGQVGDGTTTDRLTPVLVASDLPGRRGDLRLRRQGRWRGGLLGTPSLGLPAGQLHQRG